MVVHEHTQQLLVIERVELVDWLAAGDMSGCSARAWGAAAPSARSCSASGLCGGAGHGLLVQAVDSVHDARLVRGAGRDGVHTWRVACSRVGDDAVYHLLSGERTAVHAHASGALNEVHECRQRAVVVPAGV